MKFRDYLFFAVLAAVLIAAVRWPAAAAPLPDAAQPQTPKVSFIAKATYWLALLRLAQAAPKARPLIQELPDAVVNAPAERTLGPDGQPLIAHGAGW